MSRMNDRIYLASFVLLCVWLLVVIYHITHDGLPDTQTSSMDDDHHHSPPSVFDLMNTKQVVDSKAFITPTDPLCTYWNCVDSTKCFDRGHGLITVYVYDMMQYVDKTYLLLTPSPSKEYVQLIWALSNSVYAVKNPKEACIFIPSIDILNGGDINSESMSKVFAALPNWNNGSNHLLFNMWPSAESNNEQPMIDIQYGKAMLAASGFTQHSYRDTFDIALPFFNPYQKDKDFEYKSKANRHIYLVSSHIQIYRETFDELVALFTGRPELLLLAKCKQPASMTDRCSITGEVYSYPQVLTKARYCLITRSARVSTVGLHDMLRAGCVPVVAVTSIVMPFQEVLDWKRAVVFINDYQLHSVLDILKDIDADRHAYDNLVSQGQFFYENYLQSMSHIALTTLDILNERVLPHKVKMYADWNRPIIPDVPRNPFIIPLLPSQKQGFTAVVLAYDRIELMKQAIQNIGQSKHVAKVIVIWNNVNMRLPADTQWPSIDAPIKVIESKYNRLSNRFYPYSEIETDCVLTIDDDIIMVTAEELDFAYRVWAENPDRLIGFPPRYHTYNGTDLRYESEWMSNVSMVLTGVAFYHKYYHYMFTSSLPSNLKQWVDEHINCEDVAMNYLIANITGKAPIKVLARKKFKVTSSGISAGIITHLVARSTCMKVFTAAFGITPLRTVEFRADPVLYKAAGVDESTLWYYNDGSL